MNECPRCGRKYSEDAAYCARDGSKLHLSDVVERDPRSGQLINGRYRIHARLGEGGMALVYLAYHELLDRFVAMRFVRPVLGEEAIHLDRFIREARAACDIDHPNVAQVWDMGQAEDRSYFIATEFVRGPTLYSEITELGAIDPCRALRILRQVADALDAAHARGIVHRDISASNVMICNVAGQRDFVKVIDFGLAKSLAKGQTLTPAGMVLGGTLYLAPERWYAKPARPAADVYAAGALLFEMLTGQPPFSGSSPQELGGAHTTAPRPLASSVVAGLSPAIDDLIVRCLAIDPAARPLHGAALREELDRLLTNCADERHPALGSAATLSMVTRYRDRVPHGAWDGPALVEEIGRLQVAWRRQMDDLVPMLWDGRAPTGVEQAIIDLDGGTEEVDSFRRLVLELCAELARLRNDAVQREGDARRVVLDRRLASQPDGVREAERLLGKALAIRTDQSQRVQKTLAQVLARAAPRLARQWQVCERLWEHVEEAAGRNPQARPALVELSTLHAALLRYQAALEGLGPQGPTDHE